MIKNTPYDGLSVNLGDKNNIAYSEAFGQSLVDLKSLDSIDLHLAIEENKAENPLIPLSAALQSIKRLNLYLPYNWLSSYPSSLPLSMKTMESLTVLDLRRESIGNGVEGLSGAHLPMITSFCERHTQLKELYLKLGGFLLNDHELGSFNCLSKLTKLNHLNFKLFSPEISNRGIEYLTKSLMNLQSVMRILHFEIDVNKKCFKSSMESLASLISKLKLLEDLTITIDIMSIHLFIRAFEQNSALRNLNIHFNQIDKFGESATEEVLLLVSRLKNLKKLANLKLHFNCDVIDKGLICGFSSNALRHLKYLEITGCTF